MIRVEPLRDEGRKNFGTIAFLLNQTWVFISIENIADIVVKLDDSWNDIMHFNLL